MNKALYLSSGSSENRNKLAEFLKNVPNVSLTSYNSSGGRIPLLLAQFSDEKGLYTNVVFGLYKGFITLFSIISPKTGYLSFSSDFDVYKKDAELTPLASGDGHDWDRFFEFIQKTDFYAKLSSDTGDFTLSGVKFFLHRGGLSGRVYVSTVEILPKEAKPVITPPIIETPALDRLIQTSCTPEGNPWACFSEKHAKDFTKVLEVKGFKPYSPYDNVQKVSNIAVGFKGFQRGALVYVFDLYDQKLVSKPERGKYYEIHAMPREIFDCSYSAINYNVFNSREFSVFSAVNDADIITTVCYDSGAVDGETGECDYVEKQFHSAQIQSAVALMKSLAGEGYELK